MKWGHYSQTFQKALGLARPRPGASFGFPLGAGPQLAILGLFLLLSLNVLESQSEIPQGSLRVMRAAAKDKNELQRQAAVRLNKALFHCGIPLDAALRNAQGTNERSKDDLLRLLILIYGSDEESVEGRQMNIRMYVLGERSIKMRDCHHSNHNNGLLTLHHCGQNSILACLKLLANNRKPFESNQFGQDLANAGYLTIFGPETAELPS